MIIVLVAELEALLGEAGKLPALPGAIIARGLERALDPSAYQAELLTGQAVAAAPISRLRDLPEASGECWMRADPVVLVPDLNAVWIRTGARLEPGSPAVEELAALFAEAGLGFDLPVAERGYLKLDRLPDCHFQPPAALSGCSLDHVLPEGPDALRWKKLLSECQVLLHQYQRRGQTQAGGLWFWGPGILPPRERLRLRVSHVAGLDPELLGLADWLGLSHEPVTAPATVADASLACWTPDQALSADDNLEHLNAWLKPLWRRLRQGRLDALELAGTTRAWRLSPGRAWQFWRRAAAPLPG